MSADTSSPLASVPTDTIPLIYTTDPLTLTDAQLLSLVLDLRRRRNAFLAEEAATAAKGKKAKAPKEPSTLTTAATMAKPAGEMSVEDLFGPTEPSE